MKFIQITERLKALFLLTIQNSWHVLMRVKKQFMALDQKIQRVIYIVLLIIIFGIGTRLYSYWQAKMHSDALSVQLVSTIHPTLGGAESTLSFPGRLDPYLNAPIYARVNGYMKKWYKDIGSEVKAGELLGQIEAPEVDQQYQQAKADLVAAKGNEEFAKISYQRWKNLIAADAVSKQELDQKLTDYEAKKSLRQIAEANLIKAQTFVDYKNIPAPFAGLITERNTDVGDLVIAGGGKPLFNVVNIDKLRLFVNIPQIFKNDIQTGLSAKISVPEFPGRVFEAKVVRTAGAVNPVSGAVLIEIEMDNQDHILSSGEYAQVTLNLPSDHSVPRVPSSALIIKADGDYLATVAPDQTINLVKVIIGRDFGQELEVIGEITEAMQVVNNPPDSLYQGQKVSAIPVADSKSIKKEGQ